MAVETKRICNGTFGELWLDGDYVGECYKAQAKVGRAGTHIITHDIKSTVNKSSDLNVAQALSTGGSSGAITMDIAVKDEVESPHYEGVGVGMAFTKIITHDINSKATNSGNTTVASPVNTATVITIN